jgi:hypothetical protein
VEKGSHAVLISAIRASNGTLEGIDNAADGSKIEPLLVYAALPTLYFYLMFLLALPRLLRLPKEREIEDKGHPRD